MRGRGLRDGVLPTAGDDKSWDELKPDHVDGCYWWETRGERYLPVKGTGT